MPPASARYISTKAYLAPHLAETARERAYSLGISVSAYLAILLRNSLHHDQPPPLSVCGDRDKGKHIKQQVPLSLRPDLYGNAAQWSDGHSITTSRLIEGLVERDLATSDGLTIFPD